MKFSLLAADPAGPLTWSAAYIIDDVEPSTSYIIQIRAKNDAGWGSYPYKYKEHKTGSKWILTVGAGNIFKK